MQIANTVLSQFIESVQSTPDARAEQRRSARTAVHLTAHVTLLEANDIAGTTYTAVTRDISTGGLGLFQGRPVDRGMRMLITLPRPGSTPLTLRCVVMHCSELADGVFGVGAQIENVLGQGQTSARR